MIPGVGRLRERVCILHVGTEKTGTTSLQRFLWMNQAEFASRHVWIPRALTLDQTSGPSNHVLLSTSSHLSIDEPDDLQLQFGLRSMVMVEEHRAGLMEALDDEFRSLPYDPEAILVSNEHIHSRLRADSDIERVKSLLAPFCSTFRVIVYLRNQADLAQSLAMTAVRNGATELRVIPDFTTENGFDPILGVDFEYFDYPRLLDRLERVFGQNALDVRLYNSPRVENYDTIDDFFKDLPFDISRWAKPERENTSFSPAASLFLAKLNKYTSSRPGASLVRDRVNAYMALTHAGRLRFASSSAVTSFMQQFATSNEAVRTKWFPHLGKELFPNIPIHIKCDAQCDLSESEIFQLFFTIFGKSMEENRF